MISALKEIEVMSDEFLYQIKRCEDYYGAWKELNSAIVSYNEQICIAQDFFSVTYEALLTSMMMELIKLYDQQSDALPVKKLLNKCQSVKEFALVFCDTPEKDALYKKTLKTFDGFLENKTTKNSLKNLITRRDRYYMHNDGKRIQIQMLVDEYSFSFEEAELLLLEAKKFCSTLYQLVADKEWQPLLHQGTRLEHVRNFSGLKILLNSIH